MEVDEQNETTANSAGLAASHEPLLLYPPEMADIMHIGPLGEVVLKTDPAAEIRHLEVLAQIPLAALLAEVNDDDDVSAEEDEECAEEGDGDKVDSQASQQVCEAAAASDPPTMTFAEAQQAAAAKLAAASSEAEQLMRFLQLLRGQKQLVPRQLLARTPAISRPSEGLQVRLFQKKRQMRAATAALRDGAAALRRQQALDTHVVAQATLLRPHWQIAELTLRPFANSAKRESSSNPASAVLTVKLPPSSVSSEAIRFSSATDGRRACAETASTLTHIRSRGRAHHLTHTRMHRT
eukprot:3054345-Pleurochrysis_carterae.AAC.2